MQRRDHNPKQHVSPVPALSTPPVTSRFHRTKLLCSSMTALMCLSQGVMLYAVCNMVLLHSGFTSNGYIK